MEQPSNAHVCLGLAEVKAHVGGRWRRLQRRRRGPRRVDGAAVCNVSVRACAAIVLPMLECREGASLLNEEPCKFQPSTCDQSFGQRERFSPYPYLISRHSYTFFQSCSATRLCLWIALGHPSLLRLPLQVQYLVCEGVWTAIQMHEVKIFFQEIMLGL